MIRRDGYGCGLGNDGGLKDGDGYAFGFGDSHGNGEGFGLGSGYWDGDGRGYGPVYFEGFKIFAIVHGNGICYPEDDDSIVAVLEDEEKP